MTPDPPPDDSHPRDLAVDAALSRRLVTQGCTGAEWEAFAASLYKKAARVTYRWLVEGRIFGEASKIGRPIAPIDVAEWDSSDLRVLAHDIVQEAFTLFRAQLLDRRYDASRSALFTYFMNTVVRQFPNVFRRTINARKSWQDRVDLHGDTLEYDPPDHEDHHGTHARFATLLFTLIRGISARQQRTAAWLYFVEGKSNDQVAQQLTVSTDAARALVNRARIAMQNTYLQQNAEDGGRR